MTVSTRCRAEWDEPIAASFVRGDTAKAINCALSQWAALTLYVDDGAVKIDNNAANALYVPSLSAEKLPALRSDSGGERGAAIYTLVGTALCRIRHSAVHAESRAMPNG